MLEWFHTKVKEYRMKELSPEIMKILENIEKIFSLKGSLRVLFIFSKINLELRYLELQYLSELPLGTLNKVLTRLQEYGFIEKVERKLYKLTTEGKIFCDLIFGFDSDLCETLNQVARRNKLKKVLKNIK